MIGVTDMVVVMEGHVWCSVRGVSVDVSASEGQSVGVYVV